MLRFFLKRLQKIILWIAIPLVVLVVAMVGLAQYGYPYSPDNFRYYWRTRLIGNLFGYRETKYFPNGKVRSVEHWKLKPLADECWKSDFGCFVTYLWADYFDLDGNRIGFIRNGNGLLIRMFDNGQVRSIETVANGYSYPSGLIVYYNDDGTIDFIKYCGGDENQLGLSISLHPNGRLKDTYQSLHRKIYGKRQRWNADGTPDISPRQ